MSQDRRIYATRPLKPRARIEPEQMSRPLSGRLVWGSLALVWLLSLVFWRGGDMRPDLLLVTLAFWCVHAPSRVGLITAFLMGLVMDVHDAAPLGGQALDYTLVAYAAWLLHRRLQHFDLFGQAVHMFPAFIVAHFITAVLYSLIHGAWIGWSWLVGAVLTALLWPVIGWLLLLPRRHAGDADRASN
ncbi:MAG: rod shape-determining protein MreD [Corticimicrobacter sp.]|uniref:rod shape-determining protein MreD n=1 Tax=Corticimicrobacter sp. TaxID=2678536 RepID=UPI0032DBBDFD